MSRTEYEAPGAEIVLRAAVPGDLGIVSSRHMEFYGREYGFDLSFETYLFEGMTRFLKNRREGWDRPGLPKGAGVSRVRLLLTIRTRRPRSFGGSR